MAVISPGEVGVAVVMVAAWVLAACTGQLDNRPHGRQWRRDRRWWRG